MSLSLKLRLSIETLNDSKTHCRMEFAVDIKNRNARQFSENI